MPPPDVWYRLRLPQEVVDNCYLSALQLEAVVYACQQHETFLADGTRAGFLIGTVIILNFHVHHASHLDGLRQRKGICVDIIIIYPKKIPLIQTQRASLS